MDQKKTKVAILGTVPHKLQAPFDNEEFEIWAIAHACLGDPLKRVDRIFELHKWEEVIKWKSDQAWQLHSGIPVYLREKRSEVQNGVIYPFNRIEKKFKIFDDRNECMMTNSISWMIALAIDEGFKDIHIYGVNMSASMEYGFQKPSCEYYMGLAKGMGCNIYVPVESDLCKSYYLYGKDEEKNSEMIKKLEDRLTFTQGMHNHYKNLQNQARDAMNQFIGSLEQWRVQDQNSPEVKKKMDELNQGFQQNRVNAENYRDAVQQHIGMIEDLKYWLDVMRC